MSESVDAVVIGAGVVGLAAARALAMAGREVIVLEQHDLIGSETSSRHSEVIHAGIYYPPGSLKADVCVRGKKMLYEYVESHGVPYKKLGKLIVGRRRTVSTTSNSCPTTKSPRASRICGASPRSGPLRPA